MSKQFKNITVGTMIICAVVTGVVGLANMAYAESSTSTDKKMSIYHYHTQLELAMKKWKKGIDELTPYRYITKAQVDYVVIKHKKADPSMNQELDGLIEASKRVYAELQVVFSLCVADLAIRNEDMSSKAIIDKCMAEYATKVEESRNKK